MIIFILWSELNYSIHLGDVKGKCYLCTLNLSNTSTKLECIMGPTARVSFTEIPVADLAEASKTALTIKTRVSKKKKNLDWVIFMQFFLS